MIPMRACGTSPARWASQNAAPMESSPTSPTPSTSSKNAMAAAIATRSNITFRYARPPPETEPSAKCSISWEAPTDERDAEPGSQPHGRTIAETREGATMHANVVFVNVDATQADPAGRGLHDHVIPRISQTAGVVAAYWVEPGAGTRTPCT